MSRCGRCGAAQALRNKTVRDSAAPVLKFQTGTEGLTDKVQTPKAASQHRRLLEP